MRTFEPALDLPYVSPQGAIKFNGGGHINHSIFWQNLCPVSCAVTGSTLCCLLGMHTCLATLITGGCALAAWAGDNCRTDR